MLIGIDRVIEHNFFSQFPAAIEGILDDPASLSSNDNVGDYPRRSTTYRNQERPRNYRKTP